MKPSTIEPLDMNGIIHIEGGFFNAGVVVADGRVALAAPIIKYMAGWTVRRVLAYVAKRKWQCVFSEGSTT